MPAVVAANGDRDSMPVVVKEAMAMEIPVVASDEVGLPELVRDEFGRLAPPGDAGGARARRSPSCSSCRADAARGDGPGRPGPRDRARQTCAARPSAWRS